MKKIPLNLKEPSTVLTLIIVVSVIARLVSAFTLGDKVEEMPGTFDQISYHLLAQRVLAGEGFSFGQSWWPVTGAGEPTAHWSYFYTLYLVIVYAIFGVHPLAARVIQAILFGIFQPSLTYIIGERLFGKIAGLTAALSSAIYAYFVYYGGTLMTEPFYILSILLVMLYSIRLATDPEKENQRKNWVLLGLCMGITVLLRQVFLLMLPFIMLWIMWSIFHHRKVFPIVHYVLPVVVVIIMIAPFTIYNTVRFGRFVLLNTNSGYAFFWGNHPYYGTDFIPILPDGMYQQLIPDELLGLDEAALDRALLNLGLENVFADPGRYLRLSIGRIPDFYMFWPSPDSGRISNISRVASFGIFWPFMLGGFLLAIWKSRGKLGEMVASPMFLFVIFIVLYSILHLMTWALIRYRLPVDAVALIFAGYLIAVIDWRVLHVAKRFLGIDEQPVVVDAVHQ